MTGTIPTTHATVGNGRPGLSKSMRTAALAMLGATIVSVMTLGTIHGHTPARTSLIVFYATLITFVTGVLAEIAHRWFKPLPTPEQQRDEVARQILALQNRLDELDKLIGPAAANAAAEVRAVGWELAKLTARTRALTGPPPQAALPAGAAGTALQLRRSS